LFLYAANLLSRSSFFLPLTHGLQPTESLSNTDNFLKVARSATFKKLSGFYGSARRCKRQLKIQKYTDNGCRLSWLIDPENKRIAIYRIGKPAEILQAPSSISGEDALEGFILNLENV
jgi:hypothetical protein